MAEKTYKYTSICERDKPVQTNNISTFTQHVASCPTCKTNLPGSVIQALQPRLDQIMQQKKGGETSEEPKAIEETGSEPKSDEAPALDPLQKQFDHHLADSAAFQSLQKSATATQGNLEKVTKKLDGIGDQISSEISSLGDRLVGKTPDETVDVEPDVEPDVDEATEGKGGTGKVLSDEEETKQQGASDPGWGKGNTRPSPFGTTDKIPAAMRDGYQPGGKSRREKVTQDENSQNKEPSQNKELSEEQVVQKGDKGSKDLSSLEELRLAKEYVREQEEKMGGGKKTETEKKGDIPYVGDLTEAIKAVKGAVDAWKGTGASGGEDSFTQFSRELVLEMVKKQVTQMFTPATAAPTGSVSIVQMEAIRNLLGTFFSGVKTLPKDRQEKIIQGFSEMSPEVSQTEETGSPEQIR